MFSSATDGTELWDVTPSCFVDVFLQNSFTHLPEAHGYVQVLHLTFKTLRLAVLAWIVCVWNFHDSWPTEERSASAPFPRLNHATVDCCGTPGIREHVACWLGLHSLQAAIWLPPRGKSQHCYCSCLSQSRHKSFSVSYATFSFLFNECLAVA